jgi:hypothetical protein
VIAEVQFVTTRHLLCGQHYTMRPSLLWNVGKGLLVVYVSKDPNLIISANLATGNCSCSLIDLLPDPGF